MENEIVYLGTYEGFPTTTPQPRATGFDWLNAILNGAANILGGLFPGGINNTNTNQYPGQYPYPQQTNNTQSDNTVLYLLIGVIALYFLTKDSK